MIETQPYTAPRNKNRVDVSVVASHDLLGNIHPLSFTTEDGVTAEIDRVMRVRKNIAAMKAGGQGDCYVIRVTFNDRQVLRKLFYSKDSGRWFIERD